MVSEMASEADLDEHLCAIMGGTQLEGPLSDAGARSFGVGRLHRRTSRIVGIVSIHPRPALQAQAQQIPVDARARDILSQCGLCVARGAWLPACCCSPAWGRLSGRDSPDDRRTDQPPWCQRGQRPDGHLLADASPRLEVSFAVQYSDRHGREVRVYVGQRLLPAAEHALRRAGLQPRRLLPPRSESGPRRDSR